MSTKSWADAMSKAGHAPLFVSPTKELEHVVELSTACEFSKSLRKEYGVNLERLKSVDNPNHGFPDCYADRLNHTVNIELTELVRGELRRKVTIAWADKQWSRNQFRDRISELFNKKLSKARSHDIIVDYLVIHSCEMWISPENAQTWLEDLCLSGANWIKEAYFLQFYVPGWREYWPIHKITVNNPA